MDDKQLQGLGIENKEYTPGDEICVESPEETLEFIYQLDEQIPPNGPIRKFFDRISQRINELLYPPVNKKRREFLIEASKGTLAVAAVAFSDETFDMINRLLESGNANDPVLESIFEQFPPEELPNLKLSDVLEYEGFKPDFSKVPTTTPRNRTPSRSEAMQDYKDQVREFLESRGYTIDKNSTLFSDSKLLNSENVNTLMVASVATLPADFATLNAPALIAKGVLAIVVVAGVSYAVYEASNRNIKPVDKRHTDPRHNPFHKWGRDARDKIRDLKTRVSKKFPYGCFVVDAGNRLAKGVTRYALTYPVSEGQFKGFVLAIFDRKANGASTWITAYRVPDGHYLSPNNVAATSTIANTVDLVARELCPNLPATPQEP